MRPAFHHDLATARVADLHHHAARERAAKAAIRGAARTHASAPVPDLVTPSPAPRRMLTLADRRDPSPGR
jgi:hypothetical protein